MELIQRQVHYTQEGKRTFDQFYVDEDYNVPDTKEDVKQIVQGKGNVKVEEPAACGELSACFGEIIFSDPVCDGQRGKCARRFGGKDPV